jgi:hypothetical protein
VNLTSCNFVFLTFIEEVTMTIQVFGPEATVSILNRAFNDSSTANAIFNNQVTSAKSMGDQAFANAFAASWSGLTDAQLSKKVLTNMGILPTTDTSVAALEQALTDYFAAFGSKVSGANGQVTADTRGFIVLQLATILSGLENATGSLAVYAAAAVAWNSEVANSYTYSSNVNSTTPTASGSTGQSLNLTVNQDTVNGGTGDDTINAFASQNGTGLINTLQGVDVIDGGAGNDTLNVTLAEIGASLPVTPSMKNVENVTVRFTGNDTLDLGSATGVTAITVANSTATGYVDSIGDIATLSIKNQNSHFTILNGSGVGSATTMALNFDTVGTKTATAVNPVTLNLGSSNASKVTTANITTNNAYVDVSSGGGGDAITTATIAATGTNTLLFTTSASSLTKITATGDGSVNLMGTPANPSTIAFSKVTTLDASALKGAVTAEIGTTGKAVTVATGAGDDYIKVSAVDTTGSSATLGAGNDTLIIGAHLASFTKSSGGEGTDIINITDGSTLTSTTAKTITGFETLDISGGTNGATPGTSYNLALNNFPTVQIDEKIAGVLAGSVTLTNAPDSFGLTLASKAKDGDFYVDGGSSSAAGTSTVMVVGKDFAGTTADGDAETFTLIASMNDGDKDGTAEGHIINAATTVGAAEVLVENVVIEANVATVDGGTTATANATSAYFLTPNLTTYGTETITIKGDASVSFVGSFFNDNGNPSASTPVLPTYNVSKVDASASKGTIVLNLSGATLNSVSYTGSEGMDVYIASQKGDMIYTGKGGDGVGLSAAAIRDTLVFKAATDSQLTDASKDGKITLAGDGVNAGATKCTMDTIGAESYTSSTASGVTTGYSATSTFKTAATAQAAGDRVDLTNFGFTGAQRGVEDVSTKITDTTNLTSITNLFHSVAGNRGVAFAYVSESVVLLDASTSALATPTPTTTTAYVFVDANKDGNFTAADDLVIRLAGVSTGLAEADFNF